MVRRINAEGLGMEDIICSDNSGRNKQASEGEGESRLLQEQEPEWMGRSQSMARILKAAFDF